MATEENMTDATPPDNIAEKIRRLMRSPKSSARSLTGEPLRERDSRSSITASPLFSFGLGQSAEWLSEREGIQ
jgi:hypothetical protein